jgi:hypothetical protein
MPKRPPYFFYVVFIVVLEGPPNRPPVGVVVELKRPPVGVVVEPKRPPEGADVEPKSPPGVGVVDPKSPEVVGVVEPKSPGAGLENKGLGVVWFDWVMALEGKRPVEGLLLGLGGLSDGFPNMFATKLTILKQFLLIMDWYNWALFFNASLSQLIFQNEHCNEQIDLDWLISRKHNLKNTYNEK